MRTKPAPKPYQGDLCPTILRNERRKRCRAFFPLRFVERQVMRSTEPFNLPWLGVVRVMRLGLPSADHAREPYKQAPLDQLVRVRPACRRSCVPL
jgi:hypothetical protein